MESKDPPFAKVKTEKLSLTLLVLFLSTTGYCTHLFFFLSSILHNSTLLMGFFSSWCTHNYKNKEEQLTSTHPNICKINVKRPRQSQSLTSASIWMIHTHNATVKDVRRSTSPVSPSLYTWGAQPFSATKSADFCGLRKHVTVKCCISPQGCFSLLYNPLEIRYLHQQLLSDIRSFTALNICNVLYRFHPSQVIFRK